MTNDQRRPSPAGHWGLVIGHLLVIGAWSLGLLLQGGCNVVGAIRARRGAAAGRAALRARANADARAGGELCEPVGGRGGGRAARTLRDRRARRARRGADGRLRKGLRPSRVAAAAVPREVDRRVGQVRRRGAGAVHQIGARHDRRRPGQRGLPGARVGRRAHRRRRDGPTLWPEEGSDGYPVGEQSQLVRRPAWTTPPSAAACSGRWPTRSPSCSTSTSPTNDGGRIEVLESPCTMCNRYGGFRPGGTPQCHVQFATCSSTHSHSV